MTVEVHTKSYIHVMYYTAVVYSDPRYCKDNTAIFKDNDFFWRELGGVSEDGENSSTRNVPEYLHTKFQDI